MKMAPSLDDSRASSSTSLSAHNRLLTTDLSSCIDLSGDDDDAALSSLLDLPSLTTSLKRAMSELAMDEAVDQDQLQASNERDVLNSARFQQTWSLGAINQAFGSSKPFISIRKQQQCPTPCPTWGYDAEAIQLSSRTSLKSGPISKNASDDPEASMKDWTFTRASPVAQASNADLQMLDAKPLTFSTRPPKRARHASSVIMTETNNLGKSNVRFELSENDYLDDDGLEAFLGSTANGDAKDAETGDLVDNEPEDELLPDSAQDIIDLEADEAAEEAEEIEDEKTNELMNAAAVDEADEVLMNIIEVFSEDDDEQTELLKPQAQSYLERRQSLRRKITTRFDNFGFDVVIPSAQHGVQIYKPGDGVEFHNGTFMRIKSIYRTPTGNIILSGPFLTRYTQHGLDPKDPKSTPLLPSKGRGNELVWTVTVDHWPKREQEYVDRELSEVMRSRDIILTNQTWPSTSSQIHTGSVKRKQIYHHGPLFCRWKRIKQIPDKRLNRDYEECIVRLSESEADVKHSIIPSKLRYAWRRQHVPPGGGSATHNQQFMSSNGAMRTEKVSQYTFADCFCGCGGASRGAELAGLAVQWAFDCDEKAAKSYRANFKSAACYQQDVFDFLDRLGEPGATAAYIVDILHMSPPCQAFSLARTRGSDDVKETLQAPITSVGELLRKIKPRIATVEETAGLFSAHKTWMAHVVREMVDAGYSTKWKIMKSQFHGVPQLRKRVVIIAAGPGETLPPWPKATHGPGLRPFATIHDAIHHIPASVSHHQKISRFKNSLKTPFQSYTQAKTVTCGTVDANYHPSGQRPYTVRELACLQTFPLLQSFANANLTTARRQIGNAFPPMMARAVYRAVIKSLKETDGEKGGDN